METKLLAELTNRAVTLLFRELGVADAVRFLSQFTIRQGDYTAERESLLGSIPHHEIVTRIQEDRSKENS